MGLYLFQFIALSIALGQPLAAIANTSPILRAVRNPECSEAYRQMVLRHGPLTARRSSEGIPAGASSDRPSYLAIDPIHNRRTLPNNSFTPEASRRIEQFLAQLGASIRDLRRTDASVSPPSSGLTAQSQIYQPMRDSTILTPNRVLGGMLLTAAGLAPRLDSGPDRHPPQVMQQIHHAMRGLYRRETDTPFQWGNFFLFSEALEPPPLAPSLLTRAASVYEQQLTDARRLAQQNIPSLQRIDRLRESVFSTVRNYCATNARMLDFFRGGCGNCEANTKLFISLLQDANFPLPPGYRLGVQYFSDHVQPVLYAEGPPRRVLDLMSGRIKTDVEGPIYDPRVLLQDYLARKNMNQLDFWSSRLMLVAEDPEIPRDGPNGSLSRQRFPTPNTNTNLRFGNKPASRAYSNRPVPMFALIDFQPMDTQDNRSRIDRGNSRDDGVDGERTIFDPPVIQGEMSRQVPPGSRTASNEDIERYNLGDSAPFRIMQECRENSSAPLTNPQPGGIIGGVFVGPTFVAGPGGIPTPQNGRNADGAKPRENCLAHEMDTRVVFLRAGDQQTYDSAPAAHRLNFLRQLLRTSATSLGERADIISYLRNLRENGPTGFLRLDNAALLRAQASNREIDYFQRMEKSLRSNSSLFPQRPQDARAEEARPETFLQKELREIRDTTEWQANLDNATILRQIDDQSQRRHLPLLDLIFSGPMAANRYAGIIQETISYGSDSIRLRRPEPALIEIPIVIDHNGTAPLQEMPRRRPEEAQATGEPTERRQLNAPVRIRAPLYAQSLIRAAENGLLPNPLGHEAEALEALGDELLKPENERLRSRIIQHLASRDYGGPRDRLFGASSEILRSFTLFPNDSRSGLLRERIVSLTRNPDNPGDASAIYQHSLTGNPLLIAQDAAELLVRLEAAAGNRLAIVPTIPTIVPSGSRIIHPGTGSWESTMTGLFPGACENRDDAGHLICTLRAGETLPAITLFLEGLTPLFSAPRGSAEPQATSENCEFINAFRGLEHLRRENPISLEMQRVANDPTLNVETQILASLANRVSPIEAECQRRNPN